jgi:D-alanine-D-alanine ligase
VDELEAAIEEALRFDDDVIVERYIEGVEVHVAVLAGRAIGALEVAPACGVFDATARHLTRNKRAVEIYAPPRLSAERLRGALQIAERAARALETSGLCEVDLLVAERGNEYLLEVDALPSLGPHSLLPKLAHAAGLSFAELVEAVLFDARLHSGTRGHSRGRFSDELTSYDRSRRPSLTEPH